MALEDEVKNLTKAIEALTLQLKGNYTVDTLPPKDTPEKKPESKKSAKSVEETAPASGTKAVETVASEATEPKVTLDVLAKDFTELVAKDIAAAKSILQKYGVPKLSHLGDAHYASALVDIKEALKNG